jgi:hypothetical protein
MRSKSMQVLTNNIKTRYGAVTVYGIGNEAHKLEVSGHNEDDTPGVRAELSDTDTIAEHRAIDVMLGSTFSRTQADALIQEILAQQRLRDRLYYIIFYRRKWSRSSGWAEKPFTDDPHTDHVHFSGWAADDDNTAPWLTGEQMELRATRGMGQNGLPPSDNTMLLQRQMLMLIDPNDPNLALHPLTVDGNYGGNTAYWVSVILTGGPGDLVDGGEFGRLAALVAAHQASLAVAAHLQAVSHDGDLPDSLTFTIPAQRVTAELDGK